MVIKYGSVVPLPVWGRHCKPLPVGHCITVEGGRRGSKLPQGTMRNRERHVSCYPWAAGCQQEGRQGVSPE